MRSVTHRCADDGVWAAKSDERSHEPQRVTHSVAG